MKPTIITVVVGIITACIGLYLDSVSLMAAGCILMLVGRFGMERSRAKADAASREPKA